MEFWPVQNEMYSRHGICGSVSPIRPTCFGTTRPAAQFDFLPLAGKWRLPDRAAFRGSMAAGRASAAAGFSGGLQARFGVTPQKDETSTPGLF